MKDLVILLLGLMRKYNGNEAYEITHHIRQRALTGFSSVM